jgi:hypothetical protein
MSAVSAYCMSHLDRVAVRLVCSWDLLRVVHGTMPVLCQTARPRPGTACSPRSAAQHCTAVYVISHLGYPLPLLATAVASPHTLCTEKVPCMLALLSPCCRFVIDIQGSLIQ